MSLLIDKKLLSNEQKTEIAEKLNISNITLYNVFAGKVSVPLSFGIKLHKPKLEEQESMSCNIELRYEQQEIFNKIMEILPRARTAILSLPPSFGKTILAIAAAAKFGRKTLIIVHRGIIADQWKKTIDKYCPAAGAQIIKSAKEFAGAAAGNSMFYICGPRLICARMDFIKFLIVDEVHLIVTKSSCFEYIYPDYSLALSATPYRNDDLGLLINIYFGNEYVSLFTKREHVVHKIPYRVQYEMRYIEGNGKKKVDWNYILKQQCECAARNKMIVDIIEKNSDKNFIVLCKRKQQILLLYNIIRERNMNVYTFYGNDKIYENNARILLTTVSKCGVGFDDPRLNAMILAADVENYFIQYLGRVFRSEETRPIIYDIVDTNFVLEKHWKTRREIYKKYGGEIV
jgi:superfamily II DNA or RNA helicase